MEEIRHIVLDEAEALVTQEMRYVFHIPGREVVDADDLMTLFDQVIAKMASQKARTAGDQCPFHGTVKQPSDQRYA